MKLNAVAVSSSNISKTVEFYKILGFEFPEFKEDEQHVESLPKQGEPKLMIDSHKMMTDILGYEPKPGNHSSFAIEYSSPTELNEVAQKLTSAGYTLAKEPWDAFWGQRYAIASDPDGYKVDLYATL